MNKDVFDLGVANYEHMVGLDTIERDSDGYIQLMPTASRVDARKSELTTSISDLESKLKRFREEKSKVEKIQKTPEYKESKKKMSKKKAKQQKQNLLEMVFNDADHQAEGEEGEDEESDGTYRDSKKKTRKSKKAETTLETTYGKRFSPVVSMLHDTIFEFDQIADDISKDLANPRNQGKTMYRSSQIGNLISAKNSKLSAVKELASVVKTLSDLEYKKDKDRKATEGSDTNKAITALGAKYLRTADIFAGTGKTKKDKKGKKSSSKSEADDDDEIEDDDDSDIGTIKKQRESDQRALAAEFAKTLTAKKGDISLTPHERFIAMEGKYDIWVVLNTMDENDWKFVAVDPKTGKEIKGFKDSYPGLLPKKKACRMVFDLGRLRAQDKNTSRFYKLVLKD